jgi:hypothetical protein
MIYVCKRRWYKRFWHWITRQTYVGDGSKQRPYETLQEAVSQIPTVIPAGTKYVIDVTGHREKLPDFTIE